MGIFHSRLIMAGFLGLITLPVSAAVSVTGFSSTNTAVGGVGDVTISFTTDDANFGGAPGGGWYARVILPAGMSTGGAYAVFAACAANTIDLTPAAVPKLCGTFPVDPEIIVSNTNPGVSQVLGPGAYSITVRNVTNPNLAGQISLAQVDMFDATSGAVGSTAPLANLANFPLNITPASAIAVPAIPLFGLLSLSGLLGWFGMRKLRAP